MDAIYEYVLSVTGAAMVCAVVARLLEGKGSAAVIGRILTGIFMAVTVIGPITQIHLSDANDLLPHLSADAQAAVAEGKETAQDALVKSISKQLEAYILDKAAKLGVKLTVRVELSEDTIPIPVRVHLKGQVSPYAKSKLQSILRDELGLDKEKQIWT